jgi:ABC-type Fe3+/spermidine/putrescine transport system ATPase subunit
MTTGIELRDLRKRYEGHGGGGPWAVDGVDLKIGRGQFVTLLGPSGCGKTTTLRMIAGFEVPTSGQILRDGVDITDQPVTDREMRMVFQDFALFPNMSVGAQRRLRTPKTSADARRLFRALPRSAAGCGSTSNSCHLGDRISASIRINCRAGRSSACRWPAR